MTVRTANGTARSKATVVSNLGAAITEEARYTVDQDYFMDFRLEGQAAFEGGRKLLWKQGQIITQSELDAAFATATVTSITPATGPQAGGTAVTIRGTNFSGATGVTIGVAATSVVVVNDTTITCVTGATTAGAKNVVVADDSGNATLTNGFTYV